MQRIAIREGKAEVVRRDGELAVLVMRIPFRNIIACAPYDDAYGLPLLYCHFTCGRHLPYESVEVYRRRPGGLEHLEDVAFKNRVTLREMRDVPTRIRSEPAQRRFDREIRARRREYDHGS